MKAYLKKNPEEKGQILRIYKTDDDQKRMEVQFAHSTVDAAAEDFEVLAVTRTEILGD